MIFESTIDGKQMRCVLTPSTDLVAPVLCYSCMAPSVSMDGFARVRSVGGYTEIQLPDLVAGRAVSFALAYENPEYEPANRAWLPLGAYLRCQGAVVPLKSTLDRGVRTGAIAYAKGAEPALRLCPQPKRFDPVGGTVHVTGVRSDAEPIRRVNDLWDRAGLGPLTTQDGLPLRLMADATLAAEAYRLDISEGGIVLRHGDDAGAFYGGITLATLLRTHQGHVPLGTVDDGPRFEWRGQHLDCARHFYKVETILRLLDLMALLKLNRFHWHFADDEAFRLQLDSLPELRATHFRGEDDLVPGVFGGGARSGGSYSKEDAQRIIAHAKALCIEVMPEIEVPAHALSLCKIYPETRDPGDIGAEQSVQGYAQNVMNPAMPESWRVWEEMVTEISATFPFDLLHLGGDELPQATWQGSPAAQALMRKEGLGGTQDLQGWTMNRLARRVVEQGKTPAGWEESALGNPSIAHDAVIFSWTGQGAGLQAARDGYRVVMMPGQKTYFDMAQSHSSDDWGANWAAIISLEETINWDPVPQNEPELERNILGVEGAFWSEFTTADAEMEPMLAPRVLGVSMLGWQDNQSITTERLLGLRCIYADVFDAIGWSQS